MSPPPVQWPTAQSQPTNIERKKSLKNHRLFRGFSSTDTTTVNNNVGTGSFGRFRKRSSKSNNFFGSNDHEFVEEQQQQEHIHLPLLHPPVKKNQAAILQPITVSTIHADPCVSLSFRESTLVTTDRRGRIRTWGRP